MTTTDSFRRIDVPIPYDLPQQIGFDPTKGIHAGSEASHVAFWWDAAQGSPAVHDGYAYTSGRPRGFDKWDREAGRKFLTANVSLDDGETESLQTIRLSEVMQAADYHVGDSESVGNAAFVIDIPNKILLIGEREAACELCRSHNDPPDIVDQLPDGSATDTDDFADLFDRAATDADENDSDRSS
jgi:hypothetical protein